MMLPFIFRSEGKKLCPSFYKDPSSPVENSPKPEENPAKSEFNGARDLLLDGNQSDEVYLEQNKRYVLTYYRDFLACTHVSELTIRLYGYRCDLINLFNSLSREFSPVQTTRHEKCHTQLANFYKEKIRQIEGKEYKQAEVDLDVDLEVDLDFDDYLFQYYDSLHDFHFSQQNQIDCTVGENGYEKIRKKDNHKFAARHYAELCTALWKETGDLNSLKDLKKHYQCLYFSHLIISAELGNVESALQLSTMFSDETINLSDLCKAKHDDRCAIKYALKAYQSGAQYALIELGKWYEVKGSEIGRELAEDCYQKQINESKLWPLNDETAAAYLGRARLAKSSGNFEEACKYATLAYGENQIGGDKEAFAKLAALYDDGTAEGSSKALYCYLKDIAMRNSSDSFSKVEKLYPGTHKNEKILALENKVMEVLPVDRLIRFGRLHLVSDSPVEKEQAVASFLMAAKKFKSIDALIELAKLDDGANEGNAATYIGLADAIDRPVPNDILKPNYPLIQLGKQYEEKGVEFGFAVAKECYQLYMRRTVQCGDIITAVGHNCLATLSKKTGAFAAAIGYAKQALGTQARHGNYGDVDALVSLAELFEKDDTLEGTANALVCYLIDIEEHGRARANVFNKVMELYPLVIKDSELCERKKIIRTERDIQLFLTGEQLTKFGEALLKNGVSVHQAKGYFARAITLHNQWEAPLQFISLAGSKNGTDDEIVRVAAELVVKAKSLDRLKAWTEEKGSKTGYEVAITCYQSQILQSANFGDKFIQALSLARFSKGCGEDQDASTFVDRAFDIGKEGKGLFLNSSKYDQIYFDQARELAVRCYLNDIVLNRNIGSDTFKEVHDRHPDFNTEQIIQELEATIRPLLTLDVLNQFAQLRERS